MWCHKTTRNARGHQGSDLGKLCSKGLNRGNVVQFHNCAAIVSHALLEKEQPERRIYSGALCVEKKCSFVSIWSVGLPTVLILEQGIGAW